jgi:hypothetical protein
MVWESAEKRQGSASTPPTQLASSTQRPSTHTCPNAQAPASQLDADPLAVTQRPALQVVSLGHTAPQLPQLFGSELKATPSQRSPTQVPEPPSEAPEPAIAQAVPSGASVQVVARQLPCK